MWAAVHLSWQKITMYIELSTTIQLLLWTVHPPSPARQREPARLPAPASARPRERTHVPSVARRSAAAHAPAHDSAPVHVDSTTMRPPSPAGLREERGGRGRQLVRGWRPGRTPGIHYSLVHQLK
jgi:hypothetical protein